MLAATLFFLSFSLILSPIQGTKSTRSLQGANPILTVSSVLVEPYLMNGTGIDSHEMSGFRGYIPDLLMGLSIVADVDFVIQLPANGTYGKKTYNNTWDGMIGDILAKRADIAASALLIIKEREEVVAFTQPFMETGITFMISKPNYEENLVTFFDVFKVVTIEIWALIIFGLFVVCVCLITIDRYYPNRNEGSFGWRESSWFLFSTWMWQGYTKVPPSIGARVVVIFWWFFCTIFLLSYGASLVHVFSLRLQSMPKLPATVPEDLLYQSKVRYSTLQSGAARDFFANSKIPYIQQLWQGMLSYHESNFPESVDDAVARVRTGKYAFFFESNILDHYANNDLTCGFLVSDHRLDAEGYGFAVSKERTDLQKILSDAIVDLKNTGFLEELYKRWFAEKCPRHFIQQHTEDRLEINFQPINFANFGGIFIILVIGLVVGLSTAAAEYFILRRKTAQHLPSVVLLNEDP